MIAKTDSDYTGTAIITFEIRKSLSENATVIEPGAFSNCTNLVNLNIKENVTEIGDNAFADSKNLQNIYFYGNSPKLGNNIFKNVTATVYYPYTDKTWSWISSGITVEILPGYHGIQKQAVRQNEALHCVISGSQSRNTPMTEPKKHRK